MDDPTWQIYLLGRLHAQSNERTLSHLSGRRIGLLLACLVLRSPHPVPREELLDLLWPEALLEVARNRLSVMINSLRQQLEPAGSPPASVLVATRNTLQLAPEAFHSDYHDFLQALLASRAAGTLEERSVRLEAAVALYGGELITGSYDEWVLAERARIAELHFHALRDLAQALTQTGAPERAIEYARRAVAAEPLDEEAHCGLIRLYQATGQPSAALRQFEQLKRLLRDELQAQPSESARILAHEIKAELGHGSTRSPRLIRPITPHAGEQLETVQRRAVTLPSRLTRFFGREEEMVHLCALLAPQSDTRLVTLLGPGGTGKTRLAIETAERLLADYEGRVFFVPLADVMDANHIGGVIAKALLLPPTPGLDPASQALAVLSQASALLVLDNLEQLVPDATAPIEHLLLDTPSLRCLLTSRRVVGIKGEREITLGSLDQPAIGAGANALLESPAVALFVDRVHSVRSDFRLSDNNAGDVAMLCRALEGLPLAIELAAARARVMTPSEMRRQTGKLLSWLVDVRVGKNERHRSLRATLEWSYRLLTLEERQLFNSLSVFKGSFSTEAAAFVCLGDDPAPAETLALLERLCAASLVNVEETAESTTRFRLLETVREFASERLWESGTGAERCERHQVYYARIFCAEGMLPSGWNAQDILRIAADEGNLREALDLGLREGASAEEALRALELAHRLWAYWEAQGRWSEGRTYLRRAGLLAEKGQRHAVTIELLRRAAALSILLADYEEARALSDQGLALALSAEDVAGRAGCLSNLGSLAFAMDDYAGAKTRFEQALLSYQQMQDAPHIAACLASLGNVAFFIGNHREAQERLESALLLFRSVEDGHGIATVLSRLGNLFRNQSRFAQGDTCLQEALAILSDLGHRHGVAGCLYGLGLTAFWQSHYQEAAVQFGEALEIFQEVGARRGIGACLLNLGNIAKDRGDYDQAETYYERAIAIFHELGDRRDLASCLGELGNVALDRNKFEEALIRYTEALAIERGIGSRGGIANCQLGLGLLALARDDLSEVRLLLSEALETYADLAVPAGVSETLEAYAYLALCEAQPEKAARLIGAASALRTKIGYRRVTRPRLQASHFAEIRASIAEAAYAKAWTSGGALSEAEAISQALEPSVPANS